VGVLEPSIERDREALVLARAVGQGAGHPAGDRVEHDHRRQLATGEDVRTDRDRVGTKLRDDPLVEALEPGREQRHLALAGQLLDERLVELAAGRGEGDDSGGPGRPVCGLERSVDDIDAQEHARAATVGIVVDLARAERCGVAVVEQAKLELAAEHACERLLLGEPTECVRNLGEDVDAHGTTQGTPRRGRTAGDRGPGGG
jgi:hypothetical protein